MKKFKYIIPVLLGMAFLPSCIDKTSSYDLNDDGFNLAGFEQSVTAFAAIADGTESNFQVKMKVVGPTLMDLTSDITVTVAADESSSAIEGTHFRIDNPTITLKASENYLGLLTVTMLTDGIVTPLDVAPVLVLKVVSATGDENVTNNGKMLTITLNYACPSDLAGDYTLAVTSSSGGFFTRDETIINTGIGEYYTSSVGTWNPPLNDGHGYFFNDVCDVITVPFHDLLADMYSNDVFGHAEGNHDPVTGIITVYYTITFAAGNRTYEAIYTPLVK
jgi:hypothetical protein